MARDDPQFRIRLPAELKARVERAAENNHRSLNAEIVAVLEKAFPSSVRPEDLTLGELRQEITALIKGINDPKTLELLELFVAKVLK